METADTEKHDCFISTSPLALETSTSVEETKEAIADIEINSNDNSTSVESFSFVQGLPEQICETDGILTEINALYTHILSNECKGAATGKIGQEEAMICVCSTDSCIFIQNALIYSPRPDLFLLWERIQLY
jgi:hypothetical protein